MTDWHATWKRIVRTRSHKEIIRCNQFGNSTSKMIYQYTLSSPIEAEGPLSEFFKSSWVWGGNQRWLLGGGSMWKWVGTSRERKTGASHWEKRLAARQAGVPSGGGGVSAQWVAFLHVGYSPGGFWFPIRQKCTLPNSNATTLARPAPRTFRWDPRVWRSPFRLVEAGARNSSQRFLAFFFF